MRRSRPGVWGGALLAAALAAPLLAAALLDIASIPAKNPSKLLLKLKIDTDLTVDSADFEENLQRV
ncbi:MAG: hypothetical protein GY696_24370 [Gammaproteobacteria bacterium]|nr:hypothetical protein [Gammaproteobacteria bacterium]